MNWKHWVACLLKLLGFSPSYSTNIAGGITCGYGELDNNGFWEYPLFDHRELSEFNGSASK